MGTTSIRFRIAGQGYARRIAWDGIWTWFLGFGLIVYLGLKGGGFDPLVHDQVGIAVWWVLLAGVLVGAMPRRRLGALGWIALGSLAAFLAWTALSLIWTESAERTLADVARVAAYLGVFVLALLSRGRSESRRLVGAVAAGIVLVSLVALASRLHPAWFPEAGQTARFLLSGRERLSYPLNYWNALAALIAIGLPLVTQVATCARPALLRASAAAAIPALILTIFFTLSRGGIAAAILALGIFLVFSSDRLPKAVVLAIGGLGGTVLIAAAVHWRSLRHGFDSATAHHQGNEMLALTLVVCLAVGLFQLGVSRFLLGERRPAWTRLSRRASKRAVVASLLVVLIATVAVDAPARISNGWSEFKRGGGPGEGAERLGSVAGESRYQFWSAAVHENATQPLIGTGSGTFEYWWARNGDTGDMVRDTHSLYLQTLGELGIVGLVILATFLSAVLIGGGREVLAAGEPERAALAAALAGCVAFCVMAIFDWVWQMPVLPVAMLLLASVLLTARPTGRGGGRWHLPLRAGFAALSLALIALIATPLASTSLVRQSEADFRTSELPAALRAARSAQNAQPSAATPRLQQALVLEAMGNLGSAAEAAGAATERESTNWRTWLVLSRIEAERGRAIAAVRDYRKAKSLNPRSPLFER